MSQLLPRLALGVFAAAMIGAACADTQPSPLPESMQTILQGMHVEKYASLTLLDEQGAPMDPAAMATEIKSGHKFNMRRQKNPDGEQDVTIRLISKDAVAASPSALAPKLKAGDAFPAFHLARLDGSAIDNAALQGRYTLVSFYFATCAPCIKEVPQLNALSAQRKDINVLAVTFDTPEESKRFVDEHHLALPIVPNARPLINDVGVKAFPTLALLDPQGKVLDIAITGQIEHNGGIAAWVDKLAGAAQ
jgi:peroxiredoxin